MLILNTIFKVMAYFIVFVVVAFWFWSIVVAIYQDSRDWIKRKLRKFRGKK